MIINDNVKQGSPEWLAARLGLITASNFGDLVTGSTCKPAAGRKAYAYKIAAEAITGEPLDGYKSLEMFQGNAFESEARAAYTLLTGHTVRQVGLIYQDGARRVAASPDGLIGEVGGVEIKNVMAHTQVKYLCDGVVPADYRPQVYGSLYISGLTFWDFFSSSPGLPPLLVRTTIEDEGYQRYAEALAVGLPEMVALVDEIIAKVSAA